MHMGVTRRAESSPPACIRLAVGSCGHWSLSVASERAVAFRRAVLLAGGLGLVDEWHQSFVPGRYASATDVSLNIIGALIGAFLGQRWIENRPQVVV